jgi:hypothetical protein
MAHGGRRGPRRLVIKYDKFQNGCIILQKHIKIKIKNPFSQTMASD